MHRARFTQIPEWDLAEERKAESSDKNDKRGVTRRARESRFPFFVACVGRDDVGVSSGEDDLKADA